MKYRSMALAATLFLLASCGQDGSGQSKNGESLKPRVYNWDLDQIVDGQYLAVFETLNPQITSKITGAFTFARDSSIDELVGDVRITNAGPKLIHAQNVRVGRRCPTLDDDLNHDGVIDASEGEAVYGKVFFPLDGDLSSQSSHDGEFPVGDAYGNYIYARVTKFSTFMKDLRGPDDGEGYVKLKAKEALEIEGRVAVVHGVDEASDLPNSVRTVGRTTAAQTLPIVCGVIRKVLNPSGEVEEN
jgi:hypothetical protein